MAKLRSKRVEQLLAQTLDDFIGRPHARVLDIGAGHVVEKNRRTGLNDLADRYERLMAQGEYIGLEIEPEAQPAVVGDAHHLPFPGASMDGVLMVSVLEHLCDPIRGVDEVYRVLKPGGVFFSYAPFYFPYHASPHDYFRFTTDGYRYLLRDFAEVRLVSIGNYVAALNDVLEYPLASRGRLGRLLARAIQLPLAPLFRWRDARQDGKIAVGYGAWAKK